MAIRAQTEKLLGRCMPVTRNDRGRPVATSAMLITVPHECASEGQDVRGFLLPTNPTGGSPPGNPDVPVFSVFSMTDIEREGPRQSTEPARMAGRRMHPQRLLADDPGSRDRAPPSTHQDHMRESDEQTSRRSGSYDTVLDQLHHWVRNGASRRVPPRSPP